MPIFGDLAKMFAQQGGGMGWDAARQLALSIATGGEAEANVDPVLRIELEQLARVAELQVAGATGLDPAPGGTGLRVVPANRAVWAQTTLDAYRPLFEVLADAIHDDAPPEPPDPSDPFGFLAPFLTMVGPMMLGLTAGSMVGHLAQRSFGQYDLPIPRATGDEIVVNAPNLIAFADEWSLPRDELLLWICLHEATAHAVLSVPHVRDRIDGLLQRYLSSFQPDANLLEERLGELGDSGTGGLEGLQDAMADPEALLGAIRSPAQLDLLPQLEAVVAVVAGYVDATMDRMGTGLISNYQMLTEALRRRRVQAAAHDRFVERLFGLELHQAQYDRGRSFIDGVVERAGTDGLSRLWSSERELPTPAEVDAPGLWLARIDLPDVDGPAEA
jgi:putative hydrolase